MIGLADGDTGITDYQPVTRRNVASLPQWRRLDPAIREAVKVVSAVLPFRTNTYITDQLIDWERAPDDPMFQLTFPQREMLSKEHYDAADALLRTGRPMRELRGALNAIRYELNPHPSGQLTHNVPTVEGRSLLGMQHKYRETVLFFPSQGQTCHAYCTFCFRWAQFVGMQDLKFASREVNQLVAYLRRHPEVTDVLITGGDPMIMKTATLRRYLEPLLTLDSIISIRIGTKAVAYWPQRFVTDPDADDLLRLFEDVSAAGKQLALMGHYSHPVELSTPFAQEAVRRIRSSGANVRMQSPVIRHVNDDPQVWVDLWRTGVRLGCIPYYMFVERDTGARSYFEMPLVRCWRIFGEAYQRVSGLSRSARGPVMSAFPGKVRIDGVKDLGHRRVFVLEYLQARRPELVRRPFFAAFDEAATWFDQLRPATEADQPFFPSTGGARIRPEESHKLDRARHRTDRSSRERTLMRKLETGVAHPGDGVVRQPHLESRLDPDD